MPFQILLCDRADRVLMLRAALGAGGGGVDPLPGLVYQLAGAGAGAGARLGEGEHSGGTDGDPPLAAADAIAQHVGLGAVLADPERKASEATGPGVVGDLVAPAARTRFPDGELGQERGSVCHTTLPPGTPGGPKSPWPRVERAGL